MSEAGVTIVHDAVSDGVISSDFLAQAWSQARAAGDRSSATIEMMHDIGQMRAVGRVLDSIWHAENGAPEVEPRLMVAFAESGGYVAGVRVDGELVGAAIGFPRHPTGLHSHIAGVLPAHAGRGVGRALKLHQRAWCLERGINLITWTFDPLVARNAHLNLTRLGVIAPQYLVDHYGPMNDALNSDDPSDRLLVTWNLATPRTGEPPSWPARTVLADRSGEPVVIADPVPDGTDRILVAVPGDIEALRRTDPLLASRWRLAVRQALQPRMRAGWQIEGFRLDHHYVLCPPASSELSPATIRTTY
jgi:predicted GNAT superfamily acetyltransferase